MVYEYPENVRGYHHCRHWVNTPTQVKDYILGSHGMADVFGNAITGENKWRYRTSRVRTGQAGSEHRDMYQVEHDEMFAALRAGKPINNGEQAAISTLLAIMGREAAYTGQSITPSQVLESKLDLSPASYTFGPNPVPPVPVPGTKTFA